MIKEKGSEKKLGDVFNVLMKDYNNANLKYVTFDLHHICGTSKFEKLSLLFEKINSEIENYGFFCSSGNKSSRSQNGIIRTNCKDSLDRTNLVQSKIALRVFWSQAQSLSIVPKDSQPDSLFESVLRNVWADNGDAISIQYAGTPAGKNFHLNFCLIFFLYFTFYLFFIYFFDLLFLIYFFDLFYFYFVYLFYFVF